MIFNVQLVFIIISPDFGIHWINQPLYHKFDIFIKDINLLPHEQSILFVT